jgi:ATP-dependent protease ClpP protease subunit
VETTAKEIWVTFAGILDTAIVRGFFGLFRDAHAEGVETIHVYIHSPGGGVGDGVALYNYFNSLPMNILAYNSGTVASAAVTAYLGAKRRIVAPTGTFMVHKTVAAIPNVATVSRLQAAAGSVALDDIRTEAILRECVTFSDDQWQTHHLADLTLSAEESVQCGIAHEIGLFAPRGRLFNI